MFFDFDTVNSKYDNLTFKEWADSKNVVKDFYDISIYS
jgi:hypothetical protein